MNKKITVKRVLLIILIIYAIFFLLPKPTNVSGDNPLMKDSTGKPILIAHGGGNHEFPDNTLEAFYHAYSIDPNVMMETDVNLTKDGVILLSHDTTLDRKTTLQNADIIDTNYSDLITDLVDFSYQNSVVPNSNGYNVSGELTRYENYMGESVTPLDVNYPNGVSPRNDSIFLATTLEDLIVSFPNNAINVEVKQEGQVGLDALDKIIELMDQLDGGYQTYSRIVLVTFHKEIYQEMMNIKKTTHPDLMLAPEQNGVIKYYALFATGLSFFYRDSVNVLQLPTSQFGINLSSKSLISIANKHNIAVHYWTVDDPDEMRRLINNGADGIMTNRPSVMKQVLDEIFE
jgi:glycerophosphoryl diester phosphodiesterase